MAWIDIYPITPAAETELLRSQEVVRSIIRYHLKRLWEIPDTDIVVSIHACTVTVPDPEAARLGVLPDVKIVISTSDEKGHLAETLKDEVRGTWQDNFGNRFIAEIWVVFFHTWGCTFPPD
ncbi:hypothetical protein KJ596_01295 [Patescibacteria group bacterium]|nr:hypothetical protein [Patescibacteria group bacterium]MBU1868497.1 hypothetical protein [Patescibacteria group bacterium]